MANKNLNFNLDVKAEGSLKTLKSLKDELRGFKDEIENVETGSTQFEILAEKIRNSEVELKILNNSMRELPTASMTANFLELGQAVSGGFAIATGAMAVIGSKSEELRELQTRVQGAIAIAVGLRNMKEAILTLQLQKKAIAEKAGLIITSANIVATKLAGKVMRLFGISVKGTGKSFKILKGAIISTGIGALVVLIGMAVEAIINWTDKNKEAAKSQDKVSLALQNQNDIVVQGNEDFKTSRALNEKLKKATTDLERELVKTNEKLRLQTVALDDNSTALERNKKNLKTLADREEDQQKIITGNTKILQKNSTTIQDNIDIHTKKRDEIAKSITQEKQRIKDEADRENKRKSASKARSERVKAEKEELRKLTQEVALLEIEDENERAKAKIEQDKANAILAVAEHHNKKELIAEIDKKFDAMESERVAEHEQVIADMKTETQDKLKSLKEELATAEGETAVMKIEDEFAKEEAEIQRQLDANLRALELQQEQDLLELEQLEATEQEKQQLKDTYIALELQTKKQSAEELKLVEKSKTDAIKANNLAVVDAAGALAGALSSLAGDNKELAAASALISTYVAINKTLASGVYPQNVISAVAIGIQGLANVKKIYSTPAGNNKGGGGGSTPSIKAPKPVSGAFTVAGIEEPPPAKAFVVTDEMTDSQANLDNIRRRSTI